MWKFLPRPDKIVPLRDGNDESILATRPIVLQTNVTINKPNINQKSAQKTFYSSISDIIHIVHLKYFLFWWKNIILPLGIRRKIDAKRRSFDSSFRYPTPN